MNNDLKAQLESYSRNNFGVSLLELMKHKVEVEALPNYEIANILNIRRKHVRELIEYFALNKSKAFPARFEKRYGRGAVNIFKTIIESPNKSLSDVGRYFGFSREYARQVYKLLYGTPYTQAFRNKIKKLSVPKTPARKPRIQYLYELTDNLRSFGISAHIIKDKSINRIIANGFKLDIRISSTYKMVGRKKYFRIIYTKGLNLDCDFIICICEDMHLRTHYVIPRDIMPAGGICLIPQANHNESKYTEFKENWKLMKKRCQGKPPEITEGQDLFYLKHAVNFYLMEQP